MTHTNPIWLKKSKFVAAKENNLSASDEAEALTADILGWIAADTTRMGRFMALSGLTGDTLREAAMAPDFPLGVLNFLMSHEPTLLAYCNDRGTDPQRLADIWHRLEAASPHENAP